MCCGGGVSLRPDWPIGFGNSFGLGSGQGQGLGLVGLGLGLGLDNDIRNDLCYL